MRRFLVGLLATIGGLALLAIAGAALAVWFFLPAGPPELPERIVLDLDLREGLPEVPSGDPLSVLGLEQELTLSDAVLALDRAASDERVRGVVARLDGDAPGFAQAQELREAIGRLRAAGKFAIAFADSFGEFAPGTRGYYLAAAFEEVALQPLGALGLTALLIETPFLRGLLEKIGVQPDLEKRGAYKTAADTFTERGLTPAHREMLNSIADSLVGQVEAGIAEGRSLEPDGVARLAGGGPYSADEALAARLIDYQRYWDEVIEEAERRAGEGSLRIQLVDYLGATQAAVEAEAPVVAMVYGVGQIQRGDSEYGTAQGWIMGGDTVAGALAEAIDDPEVDAILFRIDSGGGSAVASETIGRQVRRAIAAGKPVIASMGEVAASGGYWIAMDASSIVARPATLTGSIGVLAGKPVLAGLWDKLGVEWGTVQRGESASMWSLNKPFSPQGRARLEAFLDRVYDAFVEGVARGRELPADEVREVAQGRVWTGQQAAELGLVDQLGGFAQALALAKEAAGAAPDEAVELRPFPRARSTLEQILALLEGPFSGLALLQQRLSANPVPGVLSAPPLSIR
jgi:protease IV